MLSEVRSLVAPQDLEVYDKLVVHHGREAHQTWHGGQGMLHPQGQCNHATPVSHDVGHTIPAAVGPLSLDFFVTCCLLNHLRLSRREEMAGPGLTTQDKN